MTLETVATQDLPVVWWVFWLVVVAVGVFIAFASWLTRAALREDAPPPSNHGHEQPEDARPGQDGDRPEQ